MLHQDKCVFQEDVQEDWGWKLVHGEVFRSPKNPLILSILVGNGAQLCAMVAVTLGWAFLLQVQTISHKRAVFSVCPVGILVSLKSWLPGNSYDGLLDYFWRVRILESSTLLVSSQVFIRIGGYFSSRIYVSLGGTNRKENAFLAATALPT